MIELKSVSKPVMPSKAVEAVEVASREITKGAAGATPAALSRSLQYLVAKGKSGPIRPGLVQSKVTI